MEKRVDWDGKIDLREGAGEAAEHDDEGSPERRRLSNARIAEELGISLNSIDLEAKDKDKLPQAMLAINEQQNLEVFPQKGDRMIKKMGSMAEASLVKNDRALLHSSLGAKDPD